MNQECGRAATEEVFIIKHGETCANVNLESGISFRTNLTISDWNSLPEAVKLIDNANLFKKYADDLKFTIQIFWNDYECPSKELIDTV